MIKYIVSDKKTVGFFCYPLLEIGFGIFSLVIAFIFISLFLYFNYSQLMQEWFDTVASFGIFIFLLFLGINLVKNYMHVEKKGDTWSFRQCMTSPKFELELKDNEWKGIKTIFTKESDNTDAFTEIKLKTCQEEVLFYNTKSKSEAESILSALKFIYEENVERKE